MVPFAAIVLAAAASIKATDGRALASTFVPTAKSPAPAIVLVADEGHPRSEWAPVAKKLSDAGIASLAIETRAAPKDPAQAAPDVLGAVAWLRKQNGIDGKKILLAGGGPSALAALLAATTDDAIAGVALVSSPLKRGELDGMATVGLYGARPLFVAVGKADPEAAKAALVLDASAQGSHKIHLAQSAGKGAKLIAADGEALAALVEWAQESAGLSSPGITPSGEHREPPAQPVPTCPGDGKSCG